MTGISIRAEFSNDELVRWLEDFLERMDDKSPFFKAVGSQLTNSVSARFDKEVGSDGNAWTPLRASTIRARIKRGRSAIAILRETGGLPG
ncbi:MAG: phage virion morphogenesis protein [Pseudorhodobacter sp.]|nr:phage virion morphogenesis protein [Pseudorhodobacter sp.]MDN5788508.1 phage virion morphogenesis protein [Pseudorhodobacter sp.]